MNAENTKKKPDVHTISLLVVNKPGVLVRCAQVFARRGFNIDSLVVSSSVNPKFSRMTITAQGDPGTLDQIIKQTGKLIDVINADEHTGKDSVDREYALLKVKCPAAKRDSIVQTIKGHAHIIEESEDIMILGQYGTTEQLDSLEDQLKEFGITEMVRSGKLVMAKGKSVT